MRALRFELQGETAFFKKPDVNVYAYFTYSHIHKIALSGLLGAVLGLGGYSAQYERRHPLAGSSSQGKGESAIFTEFYEVFHNAWISIVPHGDRSYFSKKIQIFNNTVGYASQEEGGVLNVREQWLEKPHWTIYVADNEGLPAGIFDRLSDYILNFRAEYTPYLGKNDHPASLLKPALIELVKPEEEPEFIDSLREAQIRSAANGVTKAFQLQSYWKEYMPAGLNAINNGYILEPYVFSNAEVDPDSLGEREMERLFVDGQRLIYFI